MSAETTPVVPPDPESVAALWAAYTSAAGGADDAGGPDDVFCFGDSLEQADRLAGLIVDGPKRATVGMVADFAEGETPPFVGGRSVFTWGDGSAAGVIRTVEVRVGAFGTVDAAFAWDEGEGDRSLASWLEGHERYFRRRCAALGLEFSDEVELYFERFELVWPVR